MKYVQTYVATYLYVYFIYRHPEARCRPHPDLVLRTLQKPDEDLLQWSMPDDDKSDGQVAMLGAPLTASEHLYPELQSLYMKTTY